MDEDGSGELELDELQEALESICYNELKAQEILARFELMDADGSGSIDFEEFVAVMTSDSQTQGKAFFNLKDEMDQGIQHKAFFEFATTYRREMLLEIIEGKGRIGDGIGDGMPESPEMEMERMRRESMLVQKEIVHSKDVRQFEQFHELFALQLVNDSKSDIEDALKKEVELKRKKANWIKEVRRNNEGARCLKFGGRRTITTKPTKMDEKKTNTVTIVEEEEEYDKEPEQPQKRRTTIYKPPKVDEKEVARRAELRSKWGEVGKEKQELREKHPLLPHNPEQQQHLLHQQRKAEEITEKDSALAYVKRQLAESFNTNLIAGMPIPKPKPDRSMSPIMRRTARHAQMRRKDNGSPETTPVPPSNANAATTTQSPRVQHLTFAKLRRHESVGNEEDFSSASEDESEDEDSLFGKKPKVLFSRVKGKTAGQTKLTQGQMMQLKLSAYKDAATEVASPRTPRVPASMPIPMPTPRTEFNPSPRRRTSFKDMKNVQKKLEKKMRSDRKKGVRLTINRTQNMGTGNGDTMF
ncbi:hypothetical protein TrLO_g3935 [Triparma laevis f. longispina]|uniref:EF-hand domain-containing protein n=1 Tax=Triparma laevis f. longispina TaxID=1714387 RepID=A0A9W7ARW3_9STRA|nr:hypothetical protein TrLO_g3935 [Triparma laevis f. longispina]